MIQLAWTKGRRRRRAMTPRERAAYESSLCLCGDCCAAHPERLVLRARREGELRKLRVVLRRGEKND